MDEFDEMDDYGTDGYEDTGEDLGYVDPAAMAGYGQPGPTKAAAAAGDINYDSAGFQQYENRQINAIQALRDARARAVEALRPPPNNDKYLALAAGFLSPTRTGGFGESVGSALQSYLPYQLAQRRDEQQYQQALGQYDMGLAQAEYEQAMKPPTFTDMYQPGGRQKVMIVNGRPYPIGGVYAGSRGATGPLAKVLDIERMTPAQRALYEKYGMPQGSQSIINVDLNEAKNFGKKLGEWDAEQYGELQKAGRNAPVNIANYQRLGAILGQINTGKFVGTINEVNKALKTAGIDPSALGLTDQTALVDAAKSISNELALQLRNPAGGAGMPGALSDSDRIFLTSMVPNVETDPRAIPLMVNWRVKLEQRNRDVANLARKYAREHDGMVDDGFYDELDKWASNNPLFTAEDQQAIEKLGASTAEPPPEMPGAAGRGQSLDEINERFKDLGGHFEMQNGSIMWVPDQ